MNNDTAEQKFANWKLIRGIGKSTPTEVKRADSSKFPFDEWATPEKSTTEYERYALFRETSEMDGSRFPPIKQKQIQNFLDKQDAFSTRRDTDVRSDTGEPLVEYIRGAEGNLEPVWSGIHNQDPAELLLPLNQKLIVQTDEIKFDRTKLPKIDPTLVGSSFYSNLMCTFGEWLITAEHFVIRRRRITDAMKDKEFAHPNFAISLNVLVHTEAGRQPEGDHEGYCQFDYLNRGGERDAKLRATQGVMITFMKICTINSIEVLCACTESGRVFIFDLAHWIYHDKTPTGAQPNECRTSKICPDDTEVLRCLLMIIDTEESAWSIDIIDQRDDKILIAIGNNKPCVSLFVVDVKTKAVVMSGSIPTYHNVPTLSFLNTNTDTNRTTLTYGTIMGDISTVEITYSEKGFHVLYLDSHLLGQEVWTITPLLSRDFMPVPKFELLNLIFQENTKRSILYSAVMDTWIINGGLPQPQGSSNLGPGIVTNLIPVPVATLEAPILQERDNFSVKLRFTTWDKEGLISNGTVIPQETFSDVADFPHSDVNHIQKHVSPSERPDSIQPYYLSFLYENNYSDNFQNKDLELYSKQWANGFPIFSNIEERPKSSTAKIDFKYNPANISGESQTDASERRNHITFRKKPLHSENYVFKSFANSPLIITIDDWTSAKETKIFKLSDSAHQGSNENSRETPKYGSPANEFLNTESPEIDQRHIRRIQPSEFSLHKWSTGTKAELLLQQRWTLHNHALKVEKFIKMHLSRENPCFSLCDYLLVTTKTKIMLIKPYPLLVTSFTSGEIFPTEDMICHRIGDLRSLNRVNFVCHIREMNCVAVASQTGLISLMRLTEYKGIPSFRQEYILGWRSQDPQNRVPGDGCVIHSIMGEPMLEYSPCSKDHLTFPLFNIVGMDYSYIPFDKVRHKGGYAILFVETIHRMHTFKIYPGDASLRL